MRLILSLLLVISAQALLSLEIKAQSQTPSCPSLNISCPTQMQQSALPVSISLSIASGSSNMNPKYSWKVSDGKIISGQGTPEISVDVSKASGLPVTVTVEVEGLPIGCDRVRSCSFTYGILDPPWSTKFDDYGFLNWKKERERLDNLAIDLQQVPSGWKSYVIIYGPRRVDEHLARVRDYLITKRGISSDRIVLVNGGHNKKVRTELWVRPTGAAEPTPDPNF